ncbi:MAG: hypothetical protein WC025_02075 [Candidatus Magasanikbacteria bacterium]
MLRKPDSQQYIPFTEILGHEPTNFYEKNLLERLDITKSPIMVDFSKEGDTWSNKEFGGLARRIDLQEFGVPGSLVESTKGQTYWVIFSEDEDEEQKLFPLKSSETLDKVQTYFKLNQIKDNITK